MFGGFDPRGRDLVFFERRRRGAIVTAALLYAAFGGYAIWSSQTEKTVQVRLEPEIKDFALEEEEEPEPEIEEEPPPPPPPNTKVEVVKKPRPRPKIKQIDEKVTEAAAESDAEKAIGVAGGPTAPGGTGTKPVKKVKKAKPPAPKKVEPKPKPAKKADAPIDPTKPVDRPEKARAPVPDSGNADPQYPAELRDKGITGRVVIKLHVHRDGTVRGAKILAKKNNATSDDDKKRASKLFVAAVIKVVKTWKFKPSTLNGQPISVWHKVTFPFSLSAG